MDRSSREVEDSRKEAQQQLEATSKRIKFSQQLLSLIIGLLVGLCGGVLYIVRRLSSLESELSRVIKSSEPNERGAEWQRGEFTKV